MNELREYLKSIGINLDECLITKKNEYDSNTSHCIINVAGRKVEIVNFGDERKVAEEACNFWMKSYA